MSKEDKIEKVYFGVKTGEEGAIYQDLKEAYLAQEQHKEKEQEEKDKEMSRKNPPFVQLTKGLSPAILFKIASESAMSIQILMYFIENMNHGNSIIVAQKEVARVVKKTRQGVAKAIKVLESHSAIAIGKVGNANVYVVNPDVAWQGAYTSRRTAILKATVILGYDDNKELFDHFGKLKDFSKENNITVEKDRFSTSKFIKNQDDDIELTEEEREKVRNSENFMLSSEEIDNIDAHYKDLEEQDKQDKLEKAIRVSEYKEEKAVREFEYSESNIPDDEPPLDI